MKTEKEESPRVRYGNQPHAKATGRIFRKKNKDTFQQYIGMQTNRSVNNTEAGEIQEISKTRETHMFPKIHKSTILQRQQTHRIEARDEIPKNQHR